ncbi:MotE family protein [Alkalihalobacillus sp. AL-G]|uniref:MotE family protein n=1 Tax=Alkalihalobacillus sp. AL-G TaxID=2926399 RepID=UPI002729F929|nr:hypothetical protein [Alkalihalobacillus sp. AL-G]WLD95155.1 hypothetical protein MOJ78_09835 [Alkalihalobacillus sp. AL-G]
MEKKSNKALWFLLVIVIPFLFAASLSVIGFSLMGVNVLDKAKGYMDTIPVVSSWVEEDQPAARSNEEMIRSMEKQITALQEKVEEAESALLEKDTKIKKQQNDIELLKNQLQEKTAENEQQDAALDKITEVYGAMAPKDAASIFENMKRGEAALIITNLEPDIQATVLAELDPKTAAELTKLLTN